MILVIIGEWFPLVWWMNLVVRDVFFLLTSIIHVLNKIINIKYNFHGQRAMTNINIGF